MDPDRIPYTDPDPHMEIWDEIEAKRARLET